MILLLECKIDSDTLIDEIIEWRVNSYLFKLYPGADNRLNKITVECKCHDFHTLLPEVTVENHKITEITFPKEDFYPEQLKMLQYLESFSAIDLGVRKIHWDNPSIHWMPENEEERLAINSYSRNIHHPKNNRTVTLKWLQDILMHRRMLGHLTEPLSPAFLHTGIFAFLFNDRGGFR
ncbi:hypothetical protein D3C87_49910 [compost metagenome]